MTDLKLGFTPIGGAFAGTIVAFCDHRLTFGPATAKALQPTGDLVQRAAKAEGFTGKRATSLTLPVPTGLGASRLVIVGVGKTDKLDPNDIVAFGGAAMGTIPGRAGEATILAEIPGAASSAGQAAALALGVTMRAYSFDRYKTKKKDDDEKPGSRRVLVAVANVAAARKAYAAYEAIGQGVIIARDLVNEPANVLYPQEFARRASALKKQEVAVDVLDEPAMKKLGMNALLGVGQGSRHDSRLVVMRWNGGKKGDAPVAFVGKGVCFDTGGISI